MSGFEDGDHCQASQTADALCSKAEDCENALQQFLQFDEYIVPIPEWMLNISGIAVPKINGYCKGKCGNTTFLSIKIESTNHIEHFLKQVGLKVRSNWRNSIVRMEVKNQNRYKIFIMEV